MNPEELDRGFIFVFNQNRQPLSEIPGIALVRGTSARGLRTRVGQRSAARLLLLLLLLVEGGKKSTESD